MWQRMFFISWPLANRRKRERERREKEREREREREEREFPDKMQPTSPKGHTHTQCPSSSQTPSPKRYYITSWGSNIRYMSLWDTFHIQMITDRKFMFSLSFSLSTICYVYLH
jgi:hypothetical protein